MESDVTVISCNYGVAPEVPAPGGIQDAYACLKDIIANHTKYGIDPSRIGIFGESGGAYITAGVSIMLAERNEGKLVKFQFQQIPMIDDFFCKDNNQPPLNDIEDAAKGFQEGVYALLGSANPARHWVSPNEVSDELCKKCPPAIILTTEFDMYRRCAVTAAKKYERNGKLIELGIMAGVHHGAYFNFNQRRTNEWYNVYKKIVKQYL